MTLAQVEAELADDEGAGGGPGGPGRMKFDSVEEADRYMRRQRKEPAA